MLKDEIPSNRCFIRGGWGFFKGDKWIKTLPPKLHSIILTPTPVDLLHMHLQMGSTKSPKKRKGCVSLVEIVSFKLGGQLLILDFRPSLDKYVYQSLTSEATPLAIQFFKRSYQITN